MQLEPRPNQSMGNANEGVEKSNGTDQNVDEHRAKRALCRILYMKGWSPAKIIQDTGMADGTVRRALKNTLETTRSKEPWLQHDRDDITQDETFVDKNLLADLLAEYGTFESHDGDESELDELESDTPNPVVIISPKPSSKAHNSPTNKLSASDRALCRILRKDYGWSFNRMATAFGMPRPGGPSPVCQAVNQPGSDDVLKDHEIVDKVKLAKLIANQVSHSAVGKEKQHVPSTPNQSYLNSSRFKPYNTSNRKNPSRAAEYRTVSSIPIAPAKANLFSPSPLQISAHRKNYADSCRPESNNAHHLLAEFLANIRPEINLSSRHGLFIHRGIDTVSKLRALKTWEDADLREALGEWFKTGEGLAGFVPLSDYELVALRQAIRKL
ncbi:hypothetical protein MIND_01258400 [Mycena indigotica]|uniref:Uncharacterized protein n=1 Tax=Mycena indigotica TaxID=2126181 RepID=A0A8H6VRB0_9AGAR|nr:uncharacterized protein MIND_01258400 [Mycena indigotica]KAF7291152.1 hypothetical protein MIND_01258400 [Mycena indigotica]